MRTYLRTYVRKSRGSDGPRASCVFCTLHSCLYIGSKQFASAFLVQQGGSQPSQASSEASNLLYCEAQASSKSSFCSVKLRHEEDIPISHRTSWLKEISAGILADRQENKKTFVQSVEGNAS